MANRAQQDRPGKNAPDEESRLNEEQGRRPHFAAAAEEQGRLARFARQPRTRRRTPACSPHEGDLGTARAGDLLRGGSFHV